MRQTETSRRPPLLERHLQQYGTDLLTLDGWRPLRTDPVSRREWAKGFGEKGMADYLYIRYLYEGPCCDLPWHRATPNVKASSLVMWIEWKRPGGRVAPHQKAWIEAERAHGALVIIAGEDFETTPEAFKAWYEKSGLCRRKLDAREVSRG